MDKKVWFSPRAFRLHAVILVVVPAFMALCIWQIDRATAGNELSWAYVFEWPFFAAYAVYMWWRLLHAVPEGTAPPAAADAASGGRTQDRARTGPSEPRPKRHRTSGRTPSWPPTTTTWHSWPSRIGAADAEAPGGGLEPPTSGSKGRRSAD